MPVVGEGDDLAGLFGLGDLGVGVDHLGAGVVLGEEGEHRAGALGAFGHVVLLQDAVAVAVFGVLAVVADGVEVAVEPGLAGGQPECAQRADQPGQQLLVGFAADAVGVAAQVGGLGQCGQPEGGGQAEVVDQRAEVVDPGAAGALGQQQRRDRLPGREQAGGGIAAAGDQVGQAQLGHRREQQQQPGMITGQGAVGGPARQRAGLDPGQPGRAAPAGLVAARQPGQSLRGQDLPHRLRGDRRALGGQRLGDLADTVLRGAQHQHPLAQRPGGLAGSLRSGLGLGEQAQLAPAQQGGHLVDRGGGVAELVGHLRRRHLLHEVGAQRLVAALRRAAGLEKELRTRPQQVS